MASPIPVTKRYAAAKGAFEVSSEGMTVLVATATKGADGDEVKGAYDIDGKTTGIPFYRRDNAWNMGFIKEPHVTQLGAGKAKTMTVMIGKEKTVLPLAGLDAALKTVLVCNEKGGQGECAAGREPVDRGRPVTSLRRRPQPAARVCIGSLT